MIENFVNLFGVAPAEAMSMIIVTKYRFFLEDQRLSQIGYMGSVDRTFARMGAREVRRLKREKYLTKKEEHRKTENDELASEEEITNNSIWQLKRSLT